MLSIWPDLQLENSRGHECSSIGKLFSLSWHSASMVNLQKEMSLIKFLFISRFISIPITQHLWSTVLEHMIYCTWHNNKTNDKTCRWELASNAIMAGVLHNCYNWINAFWKNAIRLELHNESIKEVRVNIKPRSLVKGFYYKSYPDSKVILKQCLVFIQTIILFEIDVSVFKDVGSALKFRWKPTAHMGDPNDMGLALICS